MSDRVRVESVEVHADPRGAVFEPLAPDQLVGQRNVHVVVTAPGNVRGNHFHRRGTELLTVLGPALVCWREDGAVAQVEVPRGQATRLVIPPGVSHAIRATGPEPMLLVGFNTEAFHRDEPDVVRDVLLD